MPCSVPAPDGPHRISLTEESDAEGMTPEKVAGKILEDTEKPGIGR